MHDLRTVVEKRDEVVASLCKRGATHLTAVVDEIVALDQKRRSCIQSVESLKSRRNQASQEIARFKKSGQDISTILEEMQTVAESIRIQDEQLKGFESQLNRLMFELPNMIRSEVPQGLDASRNQIIREWGVPRKFVFHPKTHDELGERLGILDFQRAAVVTGARFVFLKGWAARLERALIQFMMDTHSSRDYVEIIPPFIVNRQALVGTGQLPKFEGDVFKIEGTEYFLIPTAEVPVTNYHRDEILPSAGLPIRYVAFSPCFRSEAGNYGKDTKGMKRQHQFQKVELVVVSHPDKSAEEHERLTGDAERILQLLELPYRVVALCAGDTGFSSSKTYDLEVWAPGMNQFMEISSCSNFGEFQARRANIRFRDETGKVRHVHTLNGSGLAIGRTVIAIMENYQQENGTIDIPEALKPYF